MRSRLSTVSPDGDVHEQAGADHQHHGQRQLRDDERAVQPPEPQALSPAQASVPTVASTRVATNKAVAGLRGCRW